jgi:hypothetical protein
MGNLLEKLPKGLCNHFFYLLLTIFTNPSNHFVLQIINVCFITQQNPIRTSICTHLIISYSIFFAKNKKQNSRKGKRILSEHYYFICRP